MAHDIESQTRRVLENVKFILAATGLSLTDVSKITIILSSIADFPRMNAVYKEYFPDNPPARTTFEGKLPSADMLISVDAIAAF